MVVITLAGGLACVVVAIASVVVTNKGFDVVVSTLGGGLACVVVAVTLVG